MGLQISCLKISPREACGSQFRHTPSQVTTSIAESTAIYRIAGFTEHPVQPGLHTTKNVQYQYSISNTGQPYYHHLIAKVHLKCSLSPEVTGLSRRTYCHLATRGHQWRDDSILTYQKYMISPRFVSFRLLLLMSKQRARSSFSQAKFHDLPLQTMIHLNRFFNFEYSNMPTASMLLRQSCGHSEGALLKPSLAL